MSEAIRYDIPRGTSPSICKGCGAQIYWVRTPKNKNMPVDPDGTPHWSTCSKAADFKKARKA
jgi:hypothetical protein